VALDSRLTSFQDVKVLNQIIHVLIAQALVKSRHGAKPRDDGLADLLVSRRSPAGQQLRPKESLQFGRLLLQIGVGFFVAVRTVLIEKCLASHLCATQSKTHLRASGQKERRRAEKADEANSPRATSHRFIPPALAVWAEAAALDC